MSRAWGADFNAFLPPKENGADVAIPAPPRRLSNRSEFARNVQEGAAPRERILRGEHHRTESLDLTAVQHRHPRRTGVKQVRDAKGEIGRASCRERVCQYV